MHVQSDVCIIGDGAIGKAAALGFAQAGLKVTLLRPANPAAVVASDDWDARVYALNHAAHALLSSVKVWDALDAERVTPVDAMVVNGDANGALAFDSYGARVGALAWIVEDRNLNQALDAALKFASNVRIVTGQATSLQNESESVQIRLDNGDTLVAELLVAADGGQSWVRSRCDIGFDYRAYGQRAIVANFSCETPHRNIAYQWFSPTEGVIALLPLSGNRVSLVWSAPDALAAELTSESPAQLASRLTALAMPELGKLSPLQPETVKTFPLALVRPHAITASRIALVGDAAHVIHPLAGHGMNLGFADVAELIKVVAERGAHRDCGDARVLSRYARARKEDILLMQLATDGLAHLFATDIEPVRIVRNIGLNLVNRFPVLKRRLIGHALGKPQ